MKRILWFRRDLRVDDNPLLSFGGEVLPIFVFDENILKELPKNDKRVSFIFYHVVKLKADLQKIGLNLKIFYGKPDEIFAQFNGFDEVVASGDYDSYAKERDTKISHMLHFRYLGDTYIFKPKEVLKDDDTPYLVFTPFYKKARAALKDKNIEKVKIAEHVLAKADYEGIQKRDKILLLEIESLGFIKQNIEIVNPHVKLESFLKKIDVYQEMRDYLSSDATSDLSVDMRFGTISIREVLRAARDCGDVSEPFIRQLIFRDFYAYLLFHIPTLETQNYKYNFKGIDDEEKFKIFCEAKIGVPIIDAGVRELLKTGKMHNRVRMIVASFFTKDLLLPWQWGERFFASHLLDFDMASNVLSWQWSAGTGVDPQPYFRVFNPYLQSKKFDKDALYIKKWLPEIAYIEPKFIHDETYLLNSTLPNYPKPIVVHKEAAKKAVEFFKIKQHKPL
ncbi:MAG: deoxyribodipyrimidine photo-lyase [Sulfurimonas sp.]|uniref:cryptochrome/photolyase family protein n=1 Tax=Sulfurimonas sp. TaxID=2022749 RepID=UPI0026205D6E|nr:deoxyribodipyrimidine photo-lyase [Sulfurimonas sp.]MDD2653336.1 deoxyribodipyrimidine photo-lyase [Sulfurimonas sp.]MDD3450784.1 deoxyribodipyrimidine photo-lyase [Sulfurimonas sp.]